MEKKKKILLLCDHPLLPSGVGTQAKILIEGLLKTGKYQFLVFGGAIQHPDYKPQKVAPEKFGDDWIILPVNGYGDKNLLRQVLATERPDAMLMFTDPRFFIWVWEMEDEVRAVCPLLYWHVWDNDPTPRYNLTFYESTDHIVALSLKTLGLLQDMGYPRCSYIPHAVSADLFKPLPEEEVQKFKRDQFGPHADKKFVLFWNNRNARRKQTGDILATFAQFAKDKKDVVLMMHTAPKDPEGQDIQAVAKCYGIDDKLIISDQRITPEQMNMFYNVSDCTINLASNEGFGLGTLESLYSGTPIIVHMTGGLQFQIGDWWQDSAGGVGTNLKNQDEMTASAKQRYKKGVGNWWGVPVFPASRSCTGSQVIPYIYDDRVCHEDVVRALEKVYALGRKGRKELGQKGREWVTKNFDESRLISDWDHTFAEQIDKYQTARPISVRVACI